jgi:hypothetical protein
MLIIIPIASIFSSSLSLSLFSFVPFFVNSYPAKKVTHTQSNKSKVIMRRPLKQIVI